LKIETADLSRSAHTASGFVRDDRTQIAFVGRSNVGKSSLLNRLLRRKNLARTSSTPGRTRSINFFLINDRFYFVDLPGYGYARAGKADRRAWAELIESYFREPGTRRSVVLLIDGKVGATELDVQAFEYLGHLEAQILVVATKIDKVGRGKRASQLAEIRRTLGLPESAAPLPISALTGEGVKELWKEIELRL
jgi:GTP-binding protein